MASGISILVPTRQRPEGLMRLHESVMLLARNPDRVEVVAYVDNDDDSYRGLKADNLRIIRAHQVLLAEAWNICSENARYAIHGLFADDVEFKTRHWDDQLREAVNKYEDHIGFFYTDDASRFGADYGTHGFLHRNWIEAVGYFVPPHFSEGYVDTWLNAVAKGVGRHVFTGIVTEHLHPSQGKADMDATYELSRQRATRDKNQLRYSRFKKEREKDVQKLRAAIR